MPKLGTREYIVYGTAVYYRGGKPQINTVGEQNYGHIVDSIHLSSLLKTHYGSRAIRRPKGPMSRLQG